MPEYSALTGSPQSWECYGSSGKAGTTEPNSIHFMGDATEDVAFVTWPTWLMPLFLDLANAEIIMKISVNLHPCVVGWSGRCCRHSASHSGEWETTSGSVRRTTRIYFADQTSTETAHSNRHTQPNIHSARGPQRKQANCNRIVPLNNQISKICVSSDLFNYRFRYSYTTNWGK